MKDKSTITHMHEPTNPAAARSELSEILAPRLSVVFCGLNPALSAALDGHNFSNANNRFWRVLHLAGFTPRLLRADEEWEMLQYGCGITSAVSRPTKSAGELRKHDYVAALPALEDKIRKFAPANFAFLGKAAYAAVSQRAHIGWGRQPDEFGGASIWVLPNPSGLNRAFSLARLTDHYRELKLAMHTMQPPLSDSGES
jgi:TDG/mug DNA glycosylase family protein